MKKNKKAVQIIPETIVGIIFAVILIGSTVFLLAQCTRLSYQAERNFHEFADKIKEISKQPDETEEVFRSIQDKNKFLVLFTGDEHDIVYLSDMQYFAYPKDNCKNEACLCLCQKYGGYGEVVCSRLSCEQLKGIKVTDSWVNIRAKDGLRRVVLQIEKRNGKITITGGNKPQEPAEDTPAVTL